MTVSGPLVLQSYPCERPGGSSLPLVLLHGWGNDSRVWEPILPELCRRLEVITLDLPGFGESAPCQSREQVIDGLAATLPERFHLLGWSLGGMLAVQLAYRLPQRVAGLITIASNACFVRHSDWKTAMPAGAFDQFYGEFVANPEGTLKQFFTLQARGDSEERHLLRWFRNSRPTISPRAWLTGLDWLRQLDTREALRHLKMSSLHLFGENDQLVPCEAATKLARLSKHIRVRVIGGAGHALQISRPREVSDQVLNFLGTTSDDEENDPYRLQKRRIAESFGRAAASYDKAAELQRQVGEKLLALLPAGESPVRIADMGCGTGYFSDKVAVRYPGAHCTGIDLAPGMLDYAAGLHGDNKSLDWFCSDAEELDVADGEFDLIFSNFSYQWCQNLPQLMHEQWRVLRPGGRLVFTTVGPQTLWQLRRAWQRVDGYVHVNQFQDPGEVKDALASTGFRIEHWEEEIRTRHYARLNELTGELKAWGAHNVNPGRNTGLTGKRQLTAFRNAYEEFRTGEGLPADWQILYAVARKPAEPSS